MKVKGIQPAVKVKKLLTEGTFKPCPFCGGTDIRFGEFGANSVVYCSDCAGSQKFNRGCGAGSPEETSALCRQKVIEKWNRRPEPKKSGARIVVDLVDGRNCVKTNLETELEHASENEKLMALELTHLFIKSLKEIQESRK